MFDPSKRPYFNDSIQDLELYAKIYWEDCAFLLGMAVELFHRKTQRAVTLRDSLLERISELMAQGFPWPSTEAEASSSDTSVFIDAPATGLLGYLGYRVGANGLGNEDRLSLLDTVYTHRLPLVNTTGYMSEWGDPSTSMRLKKMADSIAAFVRNSKRRVSRPQLAIDDWTSDLNYLYLKHYLDRYSFYWPSLG